MIQTHLRRRIAELAVSALAVVLAAPAAASNLGFLARGPMSRFNDADMKLLNEAVSQALKAKDVGVANEWRNDKSGASGSITPQRAFDERGAPCRELKVVNRHRQLESSGVYTLCRRDGRWKLAQ